ncbi:MAG: EF-hand domain-containing protein [Verrucomicrobiota bacterium]|nr:EF-hand domain-containing protein [Verrucomicrobiota bacterium]
MKKVIILSAAALLLSGAGILIAQDTDIGRPGPRRGGNVEGERPNGPGRPGRPHFPLFGLFDSNRDGVIDAEEINNASQVLLRLDRNGDGQLSKDELRPPRPHAPEGEQE